MENGSKSYKYKMKVAQRVWLFASPWKSPWNSPGHNTGVAVPFSRVYSQPRDRTQVSRIAGRFFTSWAAREAQVQSRYSKIMLIITSWCLWPHYPFLGLICLCVVVLIAMFIIVALNRSSYERGCQRLGLGEVCVCPHTHTFKKKNQEYHYL